jgi:hypothetical protein
MLLFTRALAREFKTLFVRCWNGRPRGPAPPILFQVRGGTRTIAATTHAGVVLTHTSNASGETDDRVALPGMVLGEVEGASDEVVTLERSGKGHSIVKWSSAGIPLTLSIELVPPDPTHDLPPPPPFSPVPAALLIALHECGRTAAKESGRFAISEIQVQGSGERVVGTDGHVALMWGQFKFPFGDNILIPALPVFGTKLLTSMDDVRVGRTAKHLVIAMGPWMVWLPTDATSRFPDVNGLIPRRTPMVVAIDDQDAAELLERLPEMPNGDDEYRPVTLDANGVLRVRARDPDTCACQEVTLNRSTTAGTALCLAFDRRILTRILSLGCRTLRLAPDRPLIAEGHGMTFMAAVLDADLIVPPSEEAKTSPTEPPNPPRRTTVKPNETNGHVPHPRASPAPTPPVLDPLVEAEAIRTVLADALNRITKLVGLLKAGKKRERVLENVWSSLDQLRPGGS